MRLGSSREATQRLADKDKVVTEKPKPKFDYSFPERIEAEPPYVELVYMDQPVVRVPINVAARWSRFVEENARYALSVSENVFALVVPEDSLVRACDVQVVGESLVNGRLQIPMDDRLIVLRACRMLKVAGLQKALEDHLNKGCVTRPLLKLQCLEEVFDAPDDNEFRCRRFEDALQNFSAIVKLPEWTRLNVDIVRELLWDDRLQESEMEIFRAAIRWLARNPLQIPGHVDRVLQMVRFGSMSTEAKMKCLEEARDLRLDMFVRMYMVEADWYRTCTELNCPEFTTWKEYDRATHFIGENRRKDAIDEYLKRPRPERKRGGMAVTIETYPSVLDGVLSGKVDGGTWVARPRPRAVSIGGFAKGKVASDAQARRSKSVQLRSNGNAKAHRSRRRKEKTSEGSTAA